MDHCTAAPDSENTLCMDEMFSKGSPFTEKHHEKFMAQKRETCSPKRQLSFKMYPSVQQVKLFHVKFHHFLKNISKVNILLLVTYTTTVLDKAQSHEMGSFKSLHEVLQRDYSLEKPFIF